MKHFALKRFALFAVLSFVAVIGLAGFNADPSGCDSKPPTADQITTAKQTQMEKRGADIAGVPNIIHFTEKIRAKRIYELRDQAGVATFSYTQDMYGHYHWFCDSIGYPLPYATQYSSSERVAQTSEIPYQGDITLPQAEPNGLFMPTNADGTWVECINPDNPNETGVAYSEPHITTKPWPIKGALKD